MYTFKRYRYLMDVFKQAKIIVTKLVKAGHTAYFAGGWVRDYVMGHPSEDIDIATDATPAQIMDIFPNTLLIGLAFGVVIVVWEGHQFEVATFRKDLDYVDGRHPTGIVLSTAREDALRRDFTINGMFYDPLKEVIYDFVNGQEDIRRHLIRAIGNPHERFQEDRLRMLRAFRFSARFGFAIELETQQAIFENAEQLFPAVAIERIWQEFKKMAMYPCFDQAIVEMHRLTLLDVIFPELKGLPINELRHLVEAYKRFPKNCATIFYLIVLMPRLNREEKIEVAKRLKVTNRDLKLLHYFEDLNQLIKKEKENGLEDLYPWAHALANPDFSIVVEVIAATFPLNKGNELLIQLKNRFEKLKSHIERIQQKTPLISSALLQANGISAGKQMGILLTEAEKLAINNDYQDSQTVLNALKQTMLWKI
ncbi:CCA-adding enzyme [Candidatus Protochlamydia amoebophila]|uniref:CCA-adding enzyme n=2 Tax=Candidatus Protochlamydia amoebophila TaxID=362787 RepID=A0A0C1JSX9_9BACT|nr:CCA-adding enzyme [Candidatus Protochlamydia amoebophila]